MLTIYKPFEQYIAKAYIPPNHISTYTSAATATHYIYFHVDTALTAKHLHSTRPIAITTTSTGISDITRYISLKNFSTIIHNIWTQRIPTPSSKWSTLDHQHYKNIAQPTHNPPSHGLPTPTSWYNHPYNNDTHKFIPTAWHQYNTPPHILKLISGIDYIWRSQPPTSIDQPNHLSYIQNSHAANKVLY